MAGTRPTLVFDGDCGICRDWVDYWHGLTGERIVYRPYQDAAGDFPAIPVADFKRAIQFIDTDGAVYSGAAATFQALRRVPGRAVGWWLYGHVPGFAGASEWAYAFFARRRGLLARVTRLLWGARLEPERYELVSWIFLRLFGAIYLAAFASLAVQVRGLIGHAGILPVDIYLDAARQALGIDAYRVMPTLFWLDSSDAVLVGGCFIGMLLSLLVLAGWCTRAALIGLFMLYLSYVYAGQDFMSFQWDLLLLETGFLAIFLTSGSRIVIWLYRWLVFRYVLMAGAMKLLSGDVTWRELTALEYHFWTQPLPSPLAWYAAQLPHWVLFTATAATLVVELCAVFLIFMPRLLRALAACSIMVFQLLIVATGNYNFFNLLSMLLCIFLFDDAALRRVVPRRLSARVHTRAPEPGKRATVVATVLAFVVVPAGLNLMWQATMRRDLPIAGTLTRAIAPLLIVNAYGLFAVMTTTRPEIVIEGSDDGKSWREYVFHYKPGPVNRPALWNIPHQPRLDWQMWFAALGTVDQNPWFVNLLRRLLENSPPVLALLDTNPFPDHPPRYVRAQLYDYRLADRSAHDATGQWWTRQPEGIYFPVVSLEELDRQR